MTTGNCSNNEGAGEQQGAFEYGDARDPYNKNEGSQYRRATSGKPTFRRTLAPHLKGTSRHAAPGEPPPPFEVPAKQTPTREVTPNPTETQLQQPTDQDALCSPETPAEPKTNDVPEHDESPPSAHAPEPVRKNLAESSAPAAASESPEPPLLRRSARVRKQPDWFRHANFKQRRDQEEAGGKLSTEERHVWIRDQQSSSSWFREHNRRSNGAEAGTTRRKSSRRRSPHDLGSADLATWLRETRPSQARSSVSA
ncbi:hypothetical protein HPB50_017850 [Hyalomma asiaticum]|uniref:Uncharacterized protein n=1 Tax=Hyalomma asiaticum TaxID=266040 RepID=A0ACB7RSM2_HYAAI|nr:hypothetical protein HPB50_017850 [Hyalomma asiaticum]